MKCVQPMSLMRLILGRQSHRQISWILRQYLLPALYSLEESDEIFVSQTDPDEPSKTAEGFIAIPGPQDRRSNSERIVEIEAAKCQLQERRNRLLELYQVDIEEESLNRELASLKAL